MSAATLAIADTALEAPGHPQGDGGGSSPLVCLQGQGRAGGSTARQTATSALRSHSIRQQRVTHLRPLRERLAKGWRAGPGAAAPTNAIRKHGDASLWAHTIWRDVSGEDTLVNASSATASFCYKLSGRLARAQADAAAPRRNGPVAFKDRRVRDPAATTNDPSAAGATTSPRAGMSPCRCSLRPRHRSGFAVASQWHGCGTAVAPQWHRSDTARTRQWHGSGPAVASQWHRSGTTLSR